MSDYEPQGRGVATPRAHEGADLSSRKITIATVLLIVLLAVTHVALNAVLRVFTTQRADHAGLNSLEPQAFGSQVPPAPCLQTDPEAELVQWKAEQNHRLNSYGRVAGPGTVHIPIEQAKTLLLQQGLPLVGTHPALSPSKGGNVDAR